MSETTAEVGWALRPAQPEDERFLETLYCRLHAADFAGVPLPEEQVRGLIRMQARAQRLGYLRDFPAARSSIVTAGASPIGRVLVDDRDDAIRLVDLAFLPEWQGRGIGTKLIRDLQAEAQHRAMPMRLTVLPQNRALELYSRLGFQIISGGLQLGMEWKPISQGRPPDSAGTQNDTAQSSVDLTDVSADPAAEYQQLAGRSFRPEGASFELTLGEVQRYPAFGSGSFSLFFFGPLDPILRQETHVLHLLNSNGEQEREFALFLGPVAQVENRILYEAVFNL